MFSRCVLAFIALSVLALAGFAEDAPPPPLAVQAAVQQGRKYLAAGEFGPAARVLEANLAQARGDAVYLNLLAQAYRGYLGRLENDGRADLVNQYRERLAILERDLPPPITPARTSIANAPPERTLVARGQQADEALIAVEIGRLVGRADELFLTEKYAEAGQLYQQAYAQQRALPQLARERWAYCKLSKVARQINEANGSGVDWAGLEQETRDALNLAPRFEFGQKILNVIVKHTGAGVRPEAARAPPISVQHLRPQGAWQIAESANFRLYHHDQNLAEQGLAIAERTRQAVVQKWLGGNLLYPWNSKCELYFHASAQAYGQATGAPAESPGHTSISADQSDAQRVHLRRIDLRADHAHLLIAVLPHEVTHAVLAGQVSHKPIPRWADEGLAVLSETYERIGRHLTELPRFYTEGRAFTAAHLMSLDDYPEPARMAAFYGQGVCLVQYLAQEKCPAEFIRFLRTASTMGYEAAMHQHYGYGLAELDKRLERFIVHERVPTLNLAANR